MSRCLKFTKSLKVVRSIVFLMSGSTSVLAATSTMTQVSPTVPLGGPRSNAPLRRNEPHTAGWIPSDELGWRRIYGMGKGPTHVTGYAVRI